MLRDPILLVLALAISAAVPRSVVAQPDGPGRLTPEQRYFDWTALKFPIEEYARRREALIGNLRTSGGGLYLSPSGHGVSHGTTFRPVEDFLYFTGLEVPGSVLAVDADAGKVTLFAPARDSRFENPSRRNDFPGRPLADDPALAAGSGIAAIRPFTEFESFLRAAIAAGQTLRVAMGGPTPSQIGPVPVAPIQDRSPAEDLVAYLWTASPQAKLRNAFIDVARLRMVKSPAEVTVMRRAAELTARAIAEGAARVRVGVDERTLQGEFQASCHRGGSGIPFYPIVKSGPNSLWPWRVLATHYDRRNRALRDGELVIYDVGCEVDYYVSDVGRTFPVSGRFTDEQRRLLAMITAVSDAVIAAARPGVTLLDLQRLAESKIPPDQRKYMQTGLYFGHHIGLDSGDPFLSDAVLEPGMVFTIEPWYYNHDRDIAVFIEDDILITANGAEILNLPLPRTPEDLERMVGGGR